MNDRKAYYESLLVYATDTQRPYIEALIIHGSQRKAATAMGRNRSTLINTLKRVEAKASAHFDLEGVAPPGFAIERITELQGANNERKLRWIRSKKEYEQFAEEFQDFVEGVADHVAGTAKPIAKPDVKDIQKDLAVVIPMGDPHIGMYAWSREAEADFDCNIAEQLLLGAIDHLVAVSPEAEKCILINLGDFFHADTVSNQTLHSGHVLDVDGRWAKVQEIGFQIMVRCIDRALAKYPEVIVHNAIGNHDEHTSQALSAVLSAWYRDEPRVTITREYSKFWYHQWGDCMIGVHHGHTTKIKEIAMAMPAHEPKMWGDTRFRYYYLGHKHHREMKEFPGVVAEQFRTLAPKDAWHWGITAFISMRDMQSIALHKRYGEVGRRICPVEYLEDPTAKLGSKHDIVA